MTWLWFDDHPSRSLEDKVRLGAKAYLRKFKVSPEVCLVHQGMLEEGQRVQVGSVVVVTSPDVPVLKHHFQFSSERRE